MFTREKFDSLPKLEEMKFQYSYLPTLEGWGVYEDGVQIAVLDKEGETTFIQTSGFVDKDMAILIDFKLFKKRPEYQAICFEVPKEVALLPDTYETVFVGAILIRAKYHNPGCNPDEAWPQIEKMFKWLRTTDFYKCPASSVYHDSVEGGLCCHSLRVSKLVVDLMKCSKFNEVSKLGDAIFCALVHDWCKINLYEPYTKNVKNEETGVWEKVLAYRYTNNAVINLGHGVSSMFLANKFFRLSLEEASAIRWHMGAYRTTDDEFNELQNCNEQFLLVHLLQFADQLSLVKY